MNNEQELCTIIKNSVVSYGGVCWKIPDPTGAFAQTVPRPHDLFGAIDNKPLYIEAKFMKGLSSFSLQAIADHQIQSLLELKKQLPEAECWIVLGVKIPRANRVYVFKDIEIINSRRNLKMNFLKKELESIPYMLVKKDLVDLHQLN